LFIPLPLVLATGSSQQVALTEISSEQSLGPQQSGRQAMATYGVLDLTQALIGS
jgi:hypothetical protein